MWSKRTEMVHVGLSARTTTKLNWLPSISFLVTVVFTILALNSPPTLAASILLSDAFNRPDGVVGNGWEATAENAIGDLVIKGNALTTTFQPTDSGLAGIYRQIDTNNLDSITLSGTLTHASGAGIKSHYRYESGYILGSNGSLHDGYHVIFHRSDYRYPSDIGLWYGGLHKKLISTIYTPFNFEDAIETSVTYSFTDGRIFGEVKSGANATTFDFGPQANKITGNRFGIVLEDPDTRTSPVIFPTFDNYVVQGLLNNQDYGIFGDPNQTEGLSGVLDLPPTVEHQLNNNFEKPPDTRKRNVAILVHGWNSDPETWANDTMAQIESRLGALNVLCSTAPSSVNPCWEVRTVDWSDTSGFIPSVIPHLAYVSAYVIGPMLASEVIDNYGSQLNHLHLIGHSAGAHVIHRAAKKFEAEKKDGRLAPATLHLTFLDAFTPTPLVDAWTYGDVDHGVIPNFSDSYMSTLPPSTTIADALLKMAGYGVPAKAISYFIWSQTAQKLKNAYHIGVSRIDQEASITDPVSWAIQDHAWPYQFYQCSSNPALDRFIGDGSYTSEPCPSNNGVYTFGFPMSLEYNPSTTVQLLRSQYKPGYGCSAISATECVTLAEAVLVKAENTVNAVVDLGNTIISVTGSAIVKVGDKLYDLKADLTNLVNEYGQNAFLPAIQQINLSTGSPVWVRFRVDIAEGANQLRFKFRFNQNGPGYLRAFLHGKQVWAADQRDFEMGTTFDADMSIGELGPGNFEIAFRLDPLTANQASVELTHLELVRLDAVDAQNMVPNANAGVSRTVRLGSLVTLDGNASSDPDNAPLPLSHTWTQSAGPSVTLNGSNMAKPSFTPNSAGSYVFDLLVNDGMATSAPAIVVIKVPKLGDIDGDGDVDNNDLNLVLAARNKPASGPNDLRDCDGNMKIDALDARKLTTLCTRLRCATQ